MKIGPGVSELWGVENRPLPLTRPMAYTTACTTVQAVIYKPWNGIFAISVLKHVKQLKWSVIIILISADWKLRIIQYFLFLRCNTRFVLFCCLVFYCVVMQMYVVCSENLLMWLPFSSETLDETLGCFVTVHKWSGFPIRVYQIFMIRWKSYRFGIPYQNWI